MVKFEVINNTDNNLKEEIKYIKKVLKYTLKKEKVKNCIFSCILVDNQYIKKINKEYRNIDKETDVISFALEDDQSFNFNKTRVLGDIYISIDKAISQSKEYNHSLKRELSFLAVHGILHLLGYDHIEKEMEIVMFKKQELILNELGIKR